MKRQSFYLFIISFTILLSCKDGKAPADNVTNPVSLSENQQNPNFNYKIEPPKGWVIHDTTLQDIKYRFILAPDSLDYERPRINIIIASMQGSGIDDFTTRNMNNLKANMEGITLLERGTINVSSFNAQWFTYTKEQNGVVRDMINYIIPVRGFAYMITCGTNKGSMGKYRLLFDEIARSFRV